MQSIVSKVLTPLALFSCMATTTSCGSTGDSKALEASQSFVCASSECEVATDPKAMEILILHETDTPGDNGIFDSATRTKIYREYVEAGKILAIQNGTRGTITYRTKSGEDSTVRYYVVKLLTGPYAGRSVIAKDQDVK
jgi:hypothetical protein